MKKEENFQLQLNEVNGKLEGGFAVLSNDRLSKIKGGLDNSKLCNNKGTCDSFNTGICINKGGCRFANNAGDCRN